MLNTLVPYQKRISAILLRNFENRQIGYFDKGLKSAASLQTLSIEKQLEIN